eukprot:6200886-Pleurochrysis_carterae.AAC.1
MSLSQWRVRSDRGAVRQVWRRHPAELCRGSHLSQNLVKRAPRFVPWALTCAVLGAEPQNVMGEQQASINARAHHKSGKRTSLYSINEQFRASRA